MCPSPAGRPWVAPFRSPILIFSKKHLDLEIELLGDDYGEFLELFVVILFLGGACSCSKNAITNVRHHAAGTLDEYSYLRDKDVLNCSMANSKWYMPDISLSGILRIR